MSFLAVLSMRNRALIALITIVVAVFGGVALTSLKQELIPSIEFPRITVVTSYPGASPEVVNDEVSTPIEAAVQGIEGIESTSATSSTNQSVVNASFTYGTDLASAEQKVTQAISRISGSLPADLDPQVVSGSIADLPVIAIAVTSGADADADAQKQLAAQLDTIAVPALEKADGVRAADVFGAIGQRVTITPNQAALAQNGLSTRDITNAVTSNGRLIPSGSITQDGQTYSVQAGSKLASTDDIAALPLPAVGPGGPVTIGSVASVALTDDPQTSISRVNGQPALTLSVTKLPAANTVEVSHAVRDVIPTLETDIPGTTFTVVFDQAPFIEQSIESLTTEGLLGLGFAVIVIFVFLLSIRSTLVAAISIPTSVLITFIGLQTAGYTLNILTLGALTIAIGRVVDDSIVVIENIKRHLTSPSAQGLAPAAAGRMRAKLIVDAVREVAGAITASTITTVAVFLPISFVEGATGELFRPFALTVTIALLASLLVALTIVPVLAYWIVRPPKPTPERTSAVATQASPTHADAAQVTPDGEPAVHHGDHAGAAPHDAPDAASPTAVPEGHGTHALPATTDATTGATAVLTRRRAHRDEPEVADEPQTALQRRYLPILGWTLRHSVITLIAAIVVFLGTIPLGLFLQTNFLGSSGQNTFTVTQSVPVGSSLQSQSDIASASEGLLQGIDGIDTVQTTIGSSGSLLRDAFAGGGGGSITYNVTTAEGVDQEAIQADARTALESQPDPGDISVSASQGFGGSNDISVDITATSQSDLQTASDSVLSAVQGLDGVAEASSSLSASLPFVQVAVDRQKAAEAGLSEVAVGTIVSQTLQPTSVGSITIDDAQYTIYLQSAEPPQTTDELKSLSIPTATGIVPLSSLATVDIAEGPTSITTERGVRTASVSVTPKGDDLGSASREVQTAIDGVSLPAGASATLGGATSDQAEAFGQLFLALLVAILIVYVVMVATFKSLIQPLLLLSSVPFAATGAILLQLITGIPLGVPSIIGLLMLVGIVVTNAIVLVDLVNQYRTRGLSVREALVEGASRRLRPILMTALATIFALLPMAIGLTGGGGFISQPLALVVIGGLVSSTVLTLIVLPVLYNLYEGGRERRAQRREERAAARLS
ncbi:efflux RND transporter permease subunit [Cnuibacter sp. UC19_7]|uniref:efflux RND transporter permease subunit n=1 Tax=Cnuibacter sp. UC19_7 TaxID=3350166 RepID=UPI00366EDEBB